MGFGHTHRAAPNLRVQYWIDAQGTEADPLSLSDLGAGYKLIFCFQHWCPSCHSFGFPALKKMVDSLSKNGIGLAVVQTVFEGAAHNGPERLREMQRQYDLALPFGHDMPVNGERHPTIMEDYRSGGTPWFILIDPKGEIIFSDFRLDPDKLIAAFEAGEAVQLTR